MKREKWYCLMLILAALVAGILIGRSWRGPNRMAMMVTLQGKVYPSPNTGDVLEWIDEKSNHVDVTWDPAPGSNLKPPCTEPRDTPHHQCTVAYKVPNLMFYHYHCGGCGDMGVPGPNANGHIETDGTGPAPSAAQGPAPGGNTYEAAPALNPKTNLSGVYAYSGSATGDFSDINVVTYKDATKHDQIRFDQFYDDKGNSIPWKIWLSTTIQTCSETDIETGKSQTCTIQVTPKSQNYCVQYNGQTPGPATLIVNGMVPANKPPSPCPQ